MPSATGSTVYQFLGQDQDAKGDISSLTGLARPNIEYPVPNPFSDPIVARPQPNLAPEPEVLNVFLTFKSVRVYLVPRGRGSQSQLNKGPNVLNTLPD